MQMGTGRAGREPDGFSFQLTWTAIRSCIIPERPTHGSFCDGKRASRQQGNSKKSLQSAAPPPHSTYFWVILPRHTKVLRESHSKGMSPKAPKTPPSPCPSTLSRTREKHHVLLGRDGDDPLSVKSLFIIIKVEKPKKPGEGPVQLCFPLERINKLQQAQVLGAWKQIPHRDRS